MGWIRWSVCFIFILYLLFVEVVPRIKGKSNFQVLVGHLLGIVEVIIGQAGLPRETIISNSAPSGNFLPIRLLCVLIPITEVDNVTSRHENFLAM